MVETHGGRRFAVLIVFAAFLILMLGRWLQPVDRVALTIAAPFDSALSGITNTVGDTLSGIFDGPSLRQEVALLKKRNAALLQRTIADAEQRHENALFRRMLRFSESGTRLDYVVARVIGMDPNNLTPDILVSRGTSDGLRDGMTVVDQNGYFVGTITTAFPTVSRVQLLLNPSSSVGAFDPRSRATGLVEGEYGSRPQLNLVPSSADLRAGDIVMTSGQCNLFPRGLVIGQVGSVRHQNVAVYQTASIEPAADFRDLELVMVARNFIPGLPASLSCVQ